jgi:phosphate transport system protein
MARQSQAMVKKSLEALVNRDTKMAHQVIADDRFVDEMRSKLVDKIVAAIDHSASTAAPLLRLEYIVRQLERVADLATNIAEDVIYLIDGKIVRHPSRFDSDVLHDRSGGRFRRVT